MKTMAEKEKGHASRNKKDKDLPKKKSAPASGGKTDQTVKTATKEKNKLLASGNKERTRKDTAKENGLWQRSPASRSRSWRLAASRSQR